ncbi:MAG: HAD-IA family hydrolase [Alphaproteobacteria bacterium]|nr:HAD-IA family hydrolase [Alphaproteobacteria bacterium]
MHKLEAILFDLDGTLLDSAPDIRQGINLMLAEQGRPPLSLEQVKSFIGDGMMELCRKALAATGQEPSGDLFPFVQTFITHYRKVKPDPQQIFPHVRDVLENLKKQNIKMGICTNKNEGPTLGLLEQLDLLRYFGFIAGGDTFTIHKPNPGHITGVIEALEASPKGTLFVGDGINDVIACQRANLPCIVVTHGYSQDYNSIGADMLIAGFDELIPAINKLGFEI